MHFHNVIPILYSSDVVRSLTYYTEVLGFDCKWEWETPPTFGGASKDGVEIFFCLGEQGQKGTWLSIFLDNVDEYYEQIKAKGAIIHAEPKTMEWGVREMLVGDPDGHYIRFGHAAQNVGITEPLPASIRIVERTPTTDEYKKLIDAVGWTGTQTTADPSLILQAPLYAVVAEDSKTNTAVGCALLLGDNTSFYYVKDVMVHPDWQKKHIGTSMMNTVKEWLLKHAPENSLVGLYTGTALTNFYKQFGFRHAYGMNMRVKPNNK